MTNKLIDMEDKKINLERSKTIFSDLPASRKGKIPDIVTHYRRQILGRLSNIHIRSNRKDIFCFSSPRSGSTMLIEFIRQGKNTKAVNEPLSVNSVTFRRRCNIHDWKTASLLDNRNILYKKYFSDIINNKNCTYNFPFYDSRRKLYTDHIFFKILHGGEDMIPWFEQEFDGKIMLLLRHPLAVVRSHWRLPRVRHFLNNEEVRGKFSADQISVSEKILQSDDIFSIGILDWCLQNYFLTRPNIPKDWVRISYEEIVRQPELASKWLADRLDLRLPAGAVIGTKGSRSMRQKEIETKKAIEDGSEGSRNFLVGKWRQAFSKEDEDKAFNILDMFGIDYYERNRDLPKQIYMNSLEQASKRVTETRHRTFLQPAIILPIALALL